MYVCCVGKQTVKSYPYLIFPIQPQLNQKKSIANYKTPMFLNEFFLEEGTLFYYVRSNLC